MAELCADGLGGIRDEAEFGHRRTISCYAGANYCGYAPAGSVNRIMFDDMINLRLIIKVPCCGNAGGIGHAQNFA